MALHTSNIISLCSGIGGLDIGVTARLEAVGIKPRVVCYVEGDWFLVID